MQIKEYLSKETEHFIEEWKLKNEDPYLEKPKKSIFKKIFTYDSSNEDHIGIKS